MIVACACGTWKQVNHAYMSSCSFVLVPCLLSFPLLSLPLYLSYVLLPSESCTALASHQDHIHGISWVSSSLVLSGCDKGLLLAHDTRAASVAWGVTMSANGICHLGELCDNLLFSGHTNGEVSIFDIRTQRKLSSHVLHSGDVRSVAMWTQTALPHSTMAVDGAAHLFALTTSFDGQGSVWKLNAQQSVSPDGFDVTKVARLVGHTDKILSSVYSPLTHDIFTSGADGNVLSWNAANIASVSEDIHS